MGSFNHPRVYDPLDLEILEHVYEAAWARVEADNFHRDPFNDEKLQEALRKWVFALAGSHPVNFDELMEKLDRVPTSWLTKIASDGGSFPVSVA
jgi:hypothetical protein